jgi:hypothetical protein
LGVQMSADAGAAMEKIRAAGLLRTQGLIAGQWVDAYDGKTIEVRVTFRDSAVLSGTCSSRGVGNQLECGWLIGSSSSHVAALKGFYVNVFGFCDDCGSVQAERF